MNVLVQPSEAMPQRLVVHGVNWQTYEKALATFENRPLRITYDRGNLELLSPLPSHEVYKCFFLRLLDNLSDELDFGMKACGSTTFRREDLDRGLEPDECFYLANLSRVHNWARIDLSEDSPPDLAVEVDTTHSSLDRTAIYAALEVPELWRFDGESLQAYQWVDGEYVRLARSVAFPYLPLDEAVALLHQSITIADDRELRKKLRSWIRDRVVPQWEAWKARQPLSPENSE